MIKTREVFVTTWGEFDAEELTPRLRDSLMASPRRKDGNFDRRFHAVRMAEHIAEDVTKRRFLEAA
jgi:uncharacterized protein YbaA (DUF1428 family)